MFKTNIFSLLILLLSINLFSQNLHFVYNGQKIPDELNQKTTVHYNSNLKTVVEDLSEKYKLVFNYNATDINPYKPVHYSAENQSIFNVLINICRITQNKLRLTSTNHILILPEPSPLGKFAGKVFDKKSGLPLIGVNIFVKNSLNGAASDNTGSFSITRLRSGIYDLEVTYIGYKKHLIKNILLEPDSTKNFNIVLEERALKLNEIVVTPGNFSIKGERPFASQTLLKKDIQNFNIGEDIYRAINQLPGVVSNDFSAKFNIRGGESDEVLVLFDGLELYEPFHLKDFIGGIMSIIDVNVIGDVSLLTGGFPAQYGNRMSGVFNINSLDNIYGKNTLSLGLSIMNAKIASIGSFDDERGSWLFTARKGYIDIIAKMVGANDDFPSINYYDLYGNFKYKFNSNHKLSVNLLFSDDVLDFKNEQDNFDKLNTGYRSNYVWLNLNSVLSNKIDVQSVISFGAINSSREADVYNDQYEMYSANVTDRREFYYWGFKQNWIFDFSDSFLLKSGFDIISSKSEYNYDSENKIIFYDRELEQKTFESVNDIYLSPEGTRFSLYTTGRFKIDPKITAETGLRYDYISYSDEQFFSPRLNLAFELARETYLRFGWGYFYQPNFIHEIDVQDGERDFHKSQLAIHYVAGIEHNINKNWYFKIDGYIKHLPEVNPIYRNFKEDFLLVPEIEYDRTKFDIYNSLMKGLEFLLNYNSEKLYGSLSYTYSIAEDKLKSIKYLFTQKDHISQFYPRPFDQRHTLYFDINYVPNKNWHLNLAWSYHTGWPYTGKTLYKIYNSQNQYMYSLNFDDYNNKRFPPYHRMDLRIYRHFFTSAGKLSISLELINVYDRNNARYTNHKFYQQNGELRVKEEFEKWFPFIPSIGINWSYDF